MKAIVYHTYGSPDVLKLEDVEKPVPKENEVLIKVRAASINSWDWDLVRGEPFLSRIGGIFKPQYKILGADAAGRIEAVGGNVKLFQPGDDVFGDISGCNWGGFAEYVCADEKALSLKPQNMTFEEAAATPQAGLLALQGLLYNGEPKPGQKVLINGAGGGVGTFAIQIAKSFGAEVTGVDSAMKLNMMLSLGAGHVIDYAKEDFTKNGKRYDLILDVAANRSVFDCKRALNPGGAYAIIGGSAGAIFQALLLGPIISTAGNKKIGLLLHKPNKYMELIKELLEAGKIKPVIDRSYPLAEAAEAFRYFGEGRVQGKIVISI